MSKPKSVREAYDAGYCTAKYCRDLVGSGEGVQDHTDPDNPQRYCWSCYQKLEAKREAESKFVPDLEPQPEPAPKPRRVVVVRRKH